MSHSFSSIDFSSDISHLPVPTEWEENLENIMSIAIISTADLAKSLEEALLEHHKSQRVSYKLCVHVSEEMKPELVDGTLHVDYVIILADPRRSDAAEKVKEDLSYIGPVFLATSRCVIAVSWPKGILPCMVATCSEAVHQVCRGSMLHKLVQREDGQHGKKHLADRLLRLARTARGLNATRVPNVTGSFNPGPYWVCGAAGAMLQSDEEEDEDEDEDEEEDEDDDD